MVNLESISLKGEKWKPAFSPKYTEEIAKKYLASNKGRIYSINSKSIVKGRTNNRDDYLKVNFYASNGNSYNIFVHRVIALTFIKNNDPENAVNVDHINGNKRDNSIENLRWVTRSRNSRAGRDFNLLTGKRMVCKFDEDLNYIETYNSVTDAVNSVGLGKNYLNINSFTIKYGYYWFYSDFLELYAEKKFFDKIDKDHMIGSRRQSDMVCLYNSKTDKIIKVFKDAYEAHEEFNTSNKLNRFKNIMLSLPKIGNYKWRYLLEEEINNIIIYDKLYKKIKRKILESN